MSNYFLRNTLSFLLLLSIPFVGFSQNWEVFYSQDFSNYNFLNDVPDLSHSGFSPPWIYTGGAGGQIDTTGVSNDKCVRGSFSTPVQYLSFSVNLDSDFEYRFSWSARTSAGNKKVQLYYGNTSGSSSNIVSSETTLTNLYQKIPSDVISGLSGEFHFVIKPVFLSSFSGLVYLDDFTVERRALVTPTISLQESSVGILEGETLDACLLIEDLGNEDVTVDLALVSTATPHFDNFTTQTITIPGGSTSQHCFSIQSDPNDSIANPDQTYSFVLQNIIGGDATIGVNDQLDVSITDAGVPACSSLAGPDQMICRGDSIQLGCPPQEHPNPDAYYCYQWTPENLVDDPTLPQPIATVSTTTTFIVYVTDSEGNLSTDEVEIVVKPTPLLTFTPDQPILCNEDSIELEAVVWTGNYTFNWSTGQTENIVGLTTAGNYIVTVTNLDSSCEVIDSIEVEQFNLSGEILADPEFICEGTNSELLVNVSPNDGGLLYNWSTGITDSVIIADSAQYYSVTVSNEVNDCEVVLDYDLLSQEATIKIEPEHPVICIPGLIELKAEPGFVSYRWYFNNSLVGTDSTYSASTIGLYKVEVEDANGCIAIDEVEVVDATSTNGPLAIKALLESMGFYALDVTLSEPGLTGIPNDNNKSLNLTCPTDQSGGVATPYLLWNDASNLGVDIAGVEIDDLEDLLMDNLDYFHSEFGYNASRLIITQNESFCACPDFFDNIEDLFEASSLGFWVHLYQASEGGQDRLYILANVPTQESHFPGTADRIDFLDNALSIAANDSDAGNLANEAEQAVFTVSLGMLDNRLTSSLGEEEPDSTQSICSVALQNNLNALAPSGTPMHIPGDAILRFGIHPEWEGHVPPGALLGFTKLDDDSTKYYYALLKNVLPAGNRIFKGYYEINRKNELLTGEPPYTSPVIPNDFSTPVKVKLGGLIQQNGDNFYNVDTWEFVNFSGIPSTPSTGEGNLINEFPQIWFGNKLDSSTYSIDLPPISSADFGAALSNNVFPNPFDSSGVLVKIPRANGVIDYIYGFNENNSTNVSDLTYYRWNCATGEWTPFNPDTEYIINTVAFEITGFEHSGGEGEADPDYLQQPDCFNLTAEQIGDFSINPSLANPDGVDIKDHAGLDAVEKSEIQNAIDTANQRWQMTMKVIVSSDNQPEPSGDTPIDPLVTAAHDFESYDMSTTDVLYWMHYREDGSAGFCIKYGDDFFETAIDSVQLDSIEKAETKAVLANGLADAIKAKKVDLMHEGPVTDPDDPPLSISPNPEERPWFNGLRPDINEKVNFFSVSKEILGIGKATIKELKIPEILWAHESQCMFDAAGGLVGAGNGIIENNPAVAIAQGVSLAISVVKDKATRDGLIQIIKNPIKSARTIYKKTKQVFTGEEGIEKMHHASASTGVGLIVAILTGAAIGKADEFLSNLSKNPKEQLESIKTMLSDLPSNVQNKFLTTLQDFPDNLIESFMAFKGKLTNATVGSQHFLKIVGQPNLVNVWMKFHSSGLDLEGFYKKLPKTENVSFYDKFFENFMSPPPPATGGVITDDLADFITDVSNSNLLIIFSNNPAFLKSWNIMYSKLSFRTDVSLLQRMSDDIALEPAFEAFIKNNPSKLDGWKVWKGTYNSLGDPTKAVLGSGRINNTTEWNQLINEIEAAGGEVIFRPGTIAYSPGLSKGQPGQLIIDNDASITALRHEHRHFIDDQAAGYKGFEGIFDPNFRITTEYNAYKLEVQEMLNIGETSIANQLKNNFQAEVNDIMSKMGNPDQSVLDLIDDLLEL